jgi:predicted outer membrane repeat protein
VVGTGTTASCTFSQLQAAVATGGVITFNCGSAPMTIQVTSTLNLKTDRNTVIDGGGSITLDGGSAVQILSFNSANWQANDNRLTLQHITLSHAKTTPTQAIPAAPAPCSQGYDDGQGGAVYMRDGNLTVVDAIFSYNQAAQVGPDTGGGAIYVQGSKHGVVIVGSTFTNNSASNGGAVGCLFAELDVYNSLFTGNHGTGHDANNVSMSMCSVMNNGQYEIGSGGNGGALYSDGNSVNVILCGDDIESNAAGVNAFGGGLFFTSNNMAGTLTIADTIMTGNTGGAWTNVSTGSVTSAGTAVGTNCHSITITNSTLQ